MFIENNESQNRRRASRIKFAEAVQYQFKDPSLFGGCLSADISESGIRVQLNDFLPINTELLLNISLEGNKTVDCRSKIVWISKVPYSDRYQAGLEFIGAESVIKSKQAIHSYIEKSQVA